MADDLRWPHVIPSNASWPDPLATSTTMTNSKRFRAILFVAAYIGTLGIPGSPRDYMWAAETLPGHDCRLNVSSESRLCVCGYERRLFPLTCGLFDRTDLRLNEEASVLP